VRLYDRLFACADPDDLPEGTDFTSVLNPESLVVMRGAKIEPSVLADAPGSRYQFERTGYFVMDARDSRPGRAGVQPHGGAARLVGEGGGAGGAGGDGRRGG
jgi:glutaminyl-tRNA synthetase